MLSEYLLYAKCCTRLFHICFLIVTSQQPLEHLCPLFANGRTEAQKRGGLLLLGPTFSASELWADLLVGADVEEGQLVLS